jgi:charged multivesicular body protein 6
MGTSSSKSKKASKSKAAAKRAQDQVTEVDRQVLGLKTQKRKLNAYAKRVEVRPDVPTPKITKITKTDPLIMTSSSQEAIARETVKAREFAKSPATKAKALNALRLRKVQEQLSSRVDGWILQVDELLMSIEQARTTATVLEQLKMGNEALKQAQKGYSLKDVEGILGDMDDARDHEETVRAMIDGSLSVEDDEAVEAELAALEALEAEAEAEAEDAVEEEAEAKEVEAGAKEVDAEAKVVVPDMPDVPEKAPDLPDAPLGEGTDALAGKTETETETEGEMEAVAA